MLASNFWFYPGFRPRAAAPQPPQQRIQFDPGTPDGYDFFLNLGPLAEINQRLFGGEARYWQEIVLVYKTEPLEEDLTIAGPIKVGLNVSTSGTDSDFVVKLIDVYPGDFPTPAAPPGQPAPANAIKMGGYQQLVHGEPFRAKFRNGFEKPEPMAPNQPAAINFEMPDVYHTFRRGHRVMVQIQSSWFPLIDRNPQKFVDIPKAKPEDFQKATQRVYRSRGLNSSMTVSVVGKQARLVGGR